MFRVGPSGRINVIKWNKRRAYERKLRKTVYVRKKFISRARVYVCVYSTHIYMRVRARAHEYA